MTNLLCIVTGGAGDGRRARRLLDGIPATVNYYDVDKSRPRKDSLHEIRSVLQSQHWDLVVQEGTGIVGGLNLILAAYQWGQKYIISSGDPIAGFFRTTRGPALGAAFSVYERLLYRNATAFVGWTPYLTGLALQLGAPRGVTVEGGADLDLFVPYSESRRAALRDTYGLPSDHLIFGMVGSIKWSERQQYCYGLELVETLKHVKRPDVTVLVVGDGDGRAKLERRVPSSLRDRVVFTGRVPPSEVVDLLNVMDVGFITQTLDGLGNYRLTTKLPEYLACGLPVAMSPIPGYYDYALDAGWPLPDAHPASTSFHGRCARWIDALNRSEISQKSQHARDIAETHFDYDALAHRFQRFLSSLSELPELNVSSNGQSVPSVP